MLSVNSERTVRNIIRNSDMHCKRERNTQKLSKPTCAFLNTVVDNLSLNGVKVLNIRAEDGGRMQNLREKFDVCTARAVAALNTLCEYCLPFVKVGGRFIAYKGDCADEIEKSRGAIKILGGEIERIENYEFPCNGGKRTVVIIKKVGATPLKYPRGRGLERKKPL